MPSERLIDELGCSSLVPIVETESFPSSDEMRA